MLKSGSYNQDQIYSRSFSSLSERYHVNDNTSSNYMLHQKETSTSRMSHSFTPIENNHRRNVPFDGPIAAYISFNGKVCTSCEISEKGLLHFISHSSSSHMDGLHMVLVVLLGKSFDKMF